MIVHVEISRALAQPLSISTYDLLDSCTSKELFLVFILEVVAVIRCSRCWLVCDRLGRDNLRPLRFDCGRGGDVDRGVSVRLRRAHNARQQALDGRYICA